MLKKAVTPGSFLKNYLFTLLIVFLPLFMFGVFGPSEIFFGNYSEFGFIYREFGWKFLGISVVLALYRPNLTDCSKISANTDSLRFMGFYHCRVYSDHVSE